MQGARRWSVAEPEGGHDGDAASVADSREICGPDGVEMPPPCVEQDFRLCEGIADLSAEKFVTCQAFEGLAGAAELDVEPLRRSWPAVSAPRWLRHRGGDKLCCEHLRLRDHRLIVYVPVARA